MPTIGKVTINPTGLQSTVRIRQATQTTIANPNFEPKPNVSLDELVDVETAGVQDGYSIVYNSTTQKYEASPILVTEIDSVQGGTF